MLPSTPPNLKEPPPSQRSPCGPFRLIFRTSGGRASFTTRYFTPQTMFSFLAKHPPKSRTCRLDTITLDGGLSVVHFKPRDDRYLVINRLPPALTESEAQRKGLPHQGANSSLAPPLHRHLWQDETFHVISGTAKFTMGRRRRQLLAHEGEVVVVPRREAHTFCNASEEEDLVVEFVLDPASRRTDECYFRMSLLGFWKLAGVAICLGLPTLTFSCCSRERVGISP